MPGVSSSQPPRGRRCISRTVVVCRPVSSPARIAWVAMLSDPRRLLTSVDLPTPEEPSSATVSPLPHQAARRATLAGSPAVDGFDEQARLDGARSGGEPVCGVGQVGLGEDNHGMDVHLPCQDEIAFQPRNAEIQIARGDDEQRIDVCGDHLRLARIARRTAREQVDPGEDAHGLQRVRIDQQPVADRRMIVLWSGTGDIGHDRMPCPRAGDIDLAAMHRHHPDRTAGRRLLVRDMRAERRLPPQVFQGLVRRDHKAATSFIGVHSADRRSAPCPILRPSSRRLTPKTSKQGGQHCGIRRRAALS